MADPERPRSFDRGAALHKATALFWSKGYEGASPADLTTAMASHAPDLYIAFDSQKTPFRAAVDPYSESVRTTTWHALLPAPTMRHGSTTHKTLQSVVMRVAKPR